MQQKGKTRRIIQQWLLGSLVTTTREYLREWLAKRSRESGECKVVCEFMLFYSILCTMHKASMSKVYGGSSRSTASLISLLFETLELHPSQLHSVRTLSRIKSHSCVKQILAWPPPRYLCEKVWTRHLLSIGYRDG